MWGVGGVGGIREEVEGESRKGRGESRKGRGESRGGRGESRKGRGESRGGGGEWRENRRSVGALELIKEEKHASDCRLSADLFLYWRVRPNLAIT